LNFRNNFTKNKNFYKIDNGLSNNPKRFNKMFTSILALLFLVKVRILI